MLKQLKKDENGVVMVTVLIIILIMMIMTISMISMNVSSISVTEAEIKRIKAEELAMGGLALLYADQFSTNPANEIILPIELDNIDYSINSSIDRNSATPGPMGADPLTVQVDFN